eukprot:CAMPEP_0115874108 /NCGR_PEP_ID=MMETSP0287-20121206/24359_1 /TAXON_ID=412157 /ORGANISM="Chrysochromulina rotalis, Strain UIO044" /LENGTH=129 /DNA_ID=CAMNT_0003329225 /DNA_START=140 /DNA_END=526 /DNA_ORIENTATION=+
MNSCVQRSARFKVTIKCISAMLTVNDLVASLRLRARGKSGTHFTNGVRRRGRDIAYKTARTSTNVHLDKRTSIGPALCWCVDINSVPTRNMIIHTDHTAVAKYLTTDEMHLLCGMFITIADDEHRTIST